MNTLKSYALLAALGLVMTATSAELPTQEVELQPQRWRATRQTLQKISEQAGFRYAVPDTINRRAYTGVNAAKSIPAAEIIKDLCKQNGLAADVLNGVVVIHRQTGAKLNELATQLNDKDENVRLEAVWQLGWLQDVHAWPILAKIAAGNDTAMALAAAQALRTMDGTRILDWRYRNGVAWSDPETGGRDQPPPAPWQAPIGLAFPNAVSVADLNKLADSSWLPLRETAARLATGNGDAGRAVAEKLAKDSSPLVAKAATRSLQAWATPQATPAPVYKPKKIDIPKLTAAIQTTKSHDTLWRTAGRELGQIGTPEALKVLMDYAAAGHVPLSRYAIIPVAEYGGGKEIVTFLSQYTRIEEGTPLWGLAGLLDGADLAKALENSFQAKGAYWSAPPEYAAVSAGPAIVQTLIDRIPDRGYWCAMALGRIGGPKATAALIEALKSDDPGTAVAAAKGLGESGSLAAANALVAQLTNQDRLRRHWAILGLGNIGGNHVQKALEDVLQEEVTRKDRLVRAAAATFLKEISPLSPNGAKLVAGFEADDKILVPEYRPRNPKFGDDFPVNSEVFAKEIVAVTYSSIGETRIVMDWANSLAIRYGGCSGCYGNESFAFDVGSSTWFPIRAADHYFAFHDERRPNSGCSRGMTYDGVNKLVWIGSGIGGSYSPIFNFGTGLASYDLATDRYNAPPAGERMPQVAPGETHKIWTFDYQGRKIIGSISSSDGIATIDAAKCETMILPGPADMPNFNDYPPPVFVYDPVARVIMAASKKLDWRWGAIDVAGNSFKWLNAKVPDGGIENMKCGGVVYDCLNREMLLIGGPTTPTCRYDRKNDEWVDLKRENPGILSQKDNARLAVYDPEHNIVFNLLGGVWRYKAVPVGTKGYFGETK